MISYFLSVRFTFCDLRAIMLPFFMFITIDSAIRIMVYNQQLIIPFLYKYIYIAP